MGNTHNNPQEADSPGVSPCTRRTPRDRENKAEPPIEGLVARHGKGDRETLQNLKWMPTYWALQSPRTD